ncbi:hypothetical protein FQR65_LT08911 [Abscondita terminalis]|nr:hypothetical protein FQR65_LT08911 [Abscondita terminalis]
MEEDNLMYEKISSDITNIICNDPEIKNFCILPVNENKNKSPVLYEEHNLALESWCIKYLYSYIYCELFKVRHLLRRNRLPNQKEEYINKYLVTALLIHPDVSTFWNMRRDLIEKGAIDLDIELRITKLVLSNKTKSNEAFAYRKWILNRYFKTVQNDDNSSIRQLLNQELLLTETTAQKSSNNYHAWNHRIWLLENIFEKYFTSEMPEYLNLVLEQMDFSTKWISIHVSENTGFHYKEYLNKCFLKNKYIRNDLNAKSRLLIENCFKVSANCDDSTYLSMLYGERKNFNASSETLIELNNYANLVVVLLTDLIYFVKNLSEFLPQQLTVWYYRRYIIYSLLKIGYDYHKITWNVNSSLDVDLNINNELIRNYKSYCKGDALVDLNLEKLPKMPKLELDLVESSLLYRVISEFELRFIKLNCSQDCGVIDRAYSLSHFRYLKYVLEPKTLSKKGTVVDNVFQTPYGALKCGTLIGKEYGTKIDLSKGWGYVLQPTPELWTLTLPHRTQIIYTPDISMILLQLEVSPGSVVIESGTGSGSLSHALIRAVKPHGHLYTFDFHQQRVEMARSEFKEHGLTKWVTTTHKDVCTFGFGDELNQKVDAVFLDLPLPWEAIPHAKKCIKDEGGRICSFSPCIEQVQKTCLSLSKLEFQEIQTIEVLQTQYSVQTKTMGILNLDFVKVKKDDQVQEKKEKEVMRIVTSVPPSSQPGHTGYLSFATLPPIWARNVETDINNENDAI